MQRIATTLLIVFFALLPASVTAEERVGSIVPTASQRARALDTEAIPASARVAQAQSVRNDSLKNGARIGLIIGAVSLGTGAAILCAALGDNDRRSRPTVHPGVRLAITF